MKRTLDSSSSKKQPSQELRDRINSSVESGDRTHVLMSGIEDGRPVTSVLPGSTLITIRDDHKPWSWCKAVTEDIILDSKTKSPPSTVSISLLAALV